MIWYRSVPGALGEQESRDQCTAAIAWLDDISAPLVGVGNSVAWCIEPVDLEAAVGRVVAQQVSVDRETGGSFAFVLGEVYDAGPDEVPRYRGDAFDRAQFLANRVHAHEVVLDNACHDVVQRTYLFARRVGSGATVHRGHVIDIDYPYRVECQQALVHLEVPALPGDLLETFAPLETRVAERAGQDVVVLRGEEGCGARAWMAARARAHKPPLVVHIGAVPGGLEPLGSLRWALLRPFGESDVPQGYVAQGYLDGDDVAQATLQAILAGEPLPRATVLAAVESLLRRVAETDSRAWFFLHATNNVDPATQELLSTLVARGVPLLLIARAPREGEVPTWLEEAPGRLELTVQSLRQACGRMLVSTMANVSPSSDIATRAALLGGSTYQGVVEAVRSIVASGDLIHDQGTFQWRLRAKRAARPLPLEAILEERLMALDPRDQRILEGICVAPEGFPRALIESALLLDDVDAVSMHESLERLRAEQLLGTTRELAASSVALRRHVVGSMPPARIHELHRYYAHVLGGSEHARGAFALATWGFYVADGGDVRLGVDALLKAAAAAHDAGWQRSAVRLAASAIQTDPSPATREAATRIARQSIAPAPPAPDSDAVPPPPSEPPDRARDVQRQAIEALIHGNHEQVDRLIEASIAEGHDLAAADRLRAMAHLARGDVRAATKALDRARARSGNDQRQLARASLTLAWILLHQQKAAQAVRPALRALANARSHKDLRGEAAALHTLSACYRAMGRLDDAAAIAEVSPD